MDKACRVNKKVFLPNGLNHKFLYIFSWKNNIVLRKESVKTNLTALLLLLSLSAPTLALYSWLQGKKFVHREEVSEWMEEDLPESELTLLVFSRSEARSFLRWEHEREFEYHGQMYDISRSEEVGDSLYFWVWPDHAETALNRALAQVATGGRDFPGLPGGQAASLQQFFKTIYFHFSRPATSFESVSLSESLSGNIFLPTGITQSPPVPPPRS